MAQGVALAQQGLDVAAVPSRRTVFPDDSPEAS